MVTLELLMYFLLLFSRLVPILCNPLISNKGDQKCAIGEVELCNATDIWTFFSPRKQRVNITTYHPTSGV